MMPKKSVYILVTILTMAFITVGCERSYTSIDEQATPTIEFPGGTQENDMNSLATMAAQTATALASGVTPIATIAPTTGAGTPVNPIAPSPTGEAVNPIAPSPTAKAVNPIEPPPSEKPSSYVLEQGEFPYCLARRFNVAPSELLNLNGLSDTQARQLQPGLTLAIPQGGKVFPSERALNHHPDSYNVPQPMTVYAVACYFGDIYPSEITNANTIPDIDNIPTGTILTIP